MIAALILLLALVALGVPLWLYNRRHPHDNVAQPQQPEGCCGRHAVCEKQMESLSNPAADYFDDEELDAFAGREADSYTPEEIEQFRDVMLTLPPGEASLWAAALEHRRIALPTPLRDELIILIRG